MGLVLPPQHRRRPRVLVVLAHLGRFWLASKQAAGLRSTAETFASTPDWRNRRHSAGACRRFWIGKGPPICKARRLQDRDDDAHGADCENGPEWEKTTDRRSASPLGAGTISPSAHLDRAAQRRRRQSLESENSTTRNKREVASRGRVVTRLSVSVRDVAEARLALAAAVDLLDLKNPPAVRSAPSTLRRFQEVVEFVAGRIPVSVALGELVDHATDSSSSLAISRGASYFKLGLAVGATQPDWITRWQTVITPRRPEPRPSPLFTPTCRVAAPAWSKSTMPPRESAAARCWSTRRSRTVAACSTTGRRPTLQASYVKRDRGGSRPSSAGALTTDTIPTVADCDPITSRARRSL